MIKINQINKVFSKQIDSFRALDNVSVHIPSGQTVAIIGPSGSGKSTFLRCINGLESISSGSILISDKHLKINHNSIHELRANIGMVFQEFNLFPHLSVIQNICLAPNIIKKIPIEEVKIIARQLLEKVGLADKENNFPHQLSGGQKQRVAIARALAMNPSIMLFDEPTSALDPEMVGEVLDVIQNLSKQGMTMLIVTHEMNFAKNVAQRVLFFDKGKLVEDSNNPKNFFISPHDERAKAFLKKVIH